MAENWTTAETGQMEDLPIHLALEELIRMIFLEQKQEFGSDKSSIVLAINAHETEITFQKELFLIKLFCLKSISNISSYFNEGFLTTLQFVVEKMQSLIKDKSHLCQIEKCLNDNQALQRNYFFIKNLQNKTTDLKEFTLNANKFLQYQSTWYLRIYQSNVHMLSECKKIHNYLKKLRILNPSVEFIYELKIAGIICELDLPASNIIEICDKKIVIDFHQDSKTDKIDDISKKTYTGTTISLTISTMENVYRDVFTLTCLGFVFPLTEEIPGEKQHFVEFFSFGPCGEPLKLPDVIIDFISWEKYGLKAIVNSSFESTNTSFQPEVCLITQLSDRHSSKRQTFRVVIYIMFDITDKRYMMDLHVLGHLHNNLESVFDTNEENIRMAIQSCTNLVFHENISNNELTNENSVSHVSEAITNIVCRSTNDEFRENCLLTMRCSTVQDLKTIINKKLKNL